MIRINSFQMRVRGWRQADAFIEMMNTIFRFKIVDCRTGRGQNEHGDYVYVTYRDLE
jgi:hypothetical protein